MSTIDPVLSQSILDDPEMIYTMLRDIYWFPPTNKRYSGDYGIVDYGLIQRKDAAGKEISADVIDLWYAANEVYNVEDASVKRNLGFTRGTDIEKRYSKASPMKLLNTALQTLQLSR